MTYYLCHWNDGGDSNHTIIKQGQDAVGEWLRGCLWPGDLGCLDVIVEQLDALDDASGHGRSPIHFTWQGDHYTYSITEITDIGVFASDEWVVIPKDSFNMIVADCQRARRCIIGDRFITVSMRRAQEYLEGMLRLFGVTIDG